MMNQALANHVLEEESGAGSAGAGREHPRRIALLGNPNTGKTTLFNRLSGLRHKTSNFPGTTQEARIGRVRLERDEASPSEAAADSEAGGSGCELIDLPGVYSLELRQSEAEVCRNVLAGTSAPRGEPVGPPDAACVVVDSTNLSRNMVLVGEVLRRRLPTVIVLTMADIAQRRGLRIDVKRLGDLLGCEVVACNAREGSGIETVRRALAGARIPNVTPPGDEAGLAAWAEAMALEATMQPAHPDADRMTDRLDRVLTHPVAGTLIFAATMGLLFWVIFSIATVPMDMIDALFVHLGGFIKSVLPPGILNDFLSDGVVGGIGATVIFLPQICLLFFLISILEDTGYLARAAFVADRLMRPFGLPGHAFVPLLSSHACALPGIMAARAIPDRRERLATILVAPFMTCSARIPVYVLMATLLFPGRPGMQAAAFAGSYAVGAGAGLLSALLLRRTILKGQSGRMALELPTFKIPSIRTALLTMYDRAMVFMKKAGTAILAICIVLWWLGSYPHVPPPQSAEALREQAAMLTTSGEASEQERREALLAEAERLEASHAAAHSFAGRIGRAVQPLFAPLGYDWQLSIGVITSFAAREVFVSTMAVVVTGQEEADASVMERLAKAKRSDGETLIFTTATSWSLLVYYVLAMQCLPTLAVTAREAGGVRWALLQLAWMLLVAYAAALAVYQGMTASGIA